MKEKSSMQESSREDGIWWKSFMRNVYENHFGAVTPKICGTPRESEIFKRCRMPALRDKI